MTSSEPVSSSTSSRYVSFSGGGWNTHSVLAGVIAGALDGLRAEKKDESLKSLFSGVRGIASNSGSSWFMGQLAFSDQFASGLEVLDSRNNYNKTGYNGQINQLFREPISQAVPVLDNILQSLPLPGRVKNKISQNLKPYTEFLQYALGIASTPAVKDLSWKSVVDKYVYSPLKDIDGKSLTSQRQDWATDKDLVVGVAMPLEPVVLDQQGTLLNKIFSQTQSAASPGLNKSFFSPFLVASKSKKNTLPTATGEFLAGNSELLLSTNKYFANPTQVRSSLPSTLNADISIVDASIASSSAAAAFSSPAIYPKLFGLLPQSLQKIERLLPDSLSNLLAFSLREYAPLVQLNSGSLSFPTQLPNTDSSLKTEDIMQSYAKSGLSRAADGGYVDNSAAAFMLHHIQDENGFINPFELTIFMNSTVDPLTGIRVKTDNLTGKLSSYWLPAEIARLFGNSTGNNSDGQIIKFDPLPIDVASSHIFDGSAWLGEQPSWSRAVGSIEMSYFDLDVKTVDNAAFDIKGGQSGKLHLFITNNKDSFAAPLKPEMLSEYNENYDVIRDLIANGGGFAFLKDAFGLSV